MNTLIQQHKKVLSTALLIGLLIGITSTWLAGKLSTSTSSQHGDEILYWVAPMDPNYRRDQPGKSPMGMDLVPVYKEARAGQKPQAGLVTIPANTVNNLGVRTALAEKKVLTQEVIALGQITFDETTLVHIHPRVSGWIDTLYVRATGDPVKKGEALYSLYSPELVNAQEELILAINSRNTSLITAAEERLLALQLPASYIEKIKQEKKVQSSIRFYAPQDGVVHNLSIREGFYVQPGTTLFSIANLDHVWIEAGVLARQAELIKAGAHVSLTVDHLPGQTWHGKVDYIYPTLDQRTRTLSLRIVADNAEKKLLPNMIAKVLIHVSDGEPVVVVPREALIRTGAQDRLVLALGEGRFKSVVVRAGAENQQYVEIQDGIEVGEEVVTSAQFLIDSESSKSADLKRMDAIEHERKSVWVIGVINELNHENRSINLSHEAITPWNMPAMTMNFRVDEHIDFITLETDKQIELRIAADQDGYTIVEVR